MFWFTLTDDAGESVTVKADSRDVYRWEKSSQTGERYVELRHISTRSMSRFYRLAHIVAKREGVFDGPLSDFADKYQLDTSAVEPTPTDAGASSET